MTEFVRGSLLYIHLITQKRPEYYTGWVPPPVLYENLNSYSYAPLGPQYLRSNLITYNEEYKLVSYSYSVGNQQLRNIYHNYSFQELWHYYSYNIGNQQLKSIYKEYSTADNLHSYTYSIGDQSLRFAVLFGQNKFVDDEDKDRWQYSCGLLGNQELKEI